MMISSSDLENALSSIGLADRDSLILHSSFSSLKPFESGPMEVLDTILSLIGPYGNLMLPTFNHSNPLPKPNFDPERTPCRTGVIPELGRQRKDAVRSLHPTHSVAVIGPDAHLLTSRHLEGRAFGIGCPIDRLANRGGKILLMGVNHTVNSTIHVAEERAGIPKDGSLERPLPRVMIRMQDNSLVEHQLDSSASCSVGFEKIASVVNTSRIELGRCILQLMDSSEFITSVQDVLSDNPGYLLCDKVTCHSCRSVAKSLVRSIA